FRASIVRRQTGGAGIVLLTATPAKNSPLELYNVIQYIDPRAWTQASIHDPEQFIDRYIDIALRPVPTATLGIAQRSAVVGFKNLAELRSILYRYAEFRTADEVGLKLPQPRKLVVDVAMDERQERKYVDGLAAIERALEKGARAGPELLGHLMRLNAVALHADLDEGYDWETAWGGTGTRVVSPRALAFWEDRGWTPAKKQGDRKGGGVTI
ncbi:MAG: hypothetical protein KDK70_43870, partial [Myxococcales bacterium]|nr:hypothetical protein [Myxococcales bacterium]